MNEELKAAIRKELIGGYDPSSHFVDRAMGRADSFIDDMISEGIVSYRYMADAVYEDNRFWED